MAQNWACFSSTDSKNKLTPLSCGKWELSEKFTDTGGRGISRGEAAVWEVTSWLPYVGRQAPSVLIGVMLALIGVMWA